MAAKKTGGTAGRLRAKNAAMAAEMKRNNVERRICRCPVCNKLVSVAGVAQHITSCKG